MGYIRMGIPKDLVLKLVAARPTPNFVETGTFKGGTTFWAAEHFRKVVTIELSLELSRQAAARSDCPGNIEFLVGDSCQVLPKVVEQLEGFALFWLDGHYSGPGTGGAASECPLLAELEALSRTSAPIILIDDARCFLGPPPPPHNPAHWVNIDRIFSCLATLFEGHVVTIHDDVIIAVPAQLKPVLDADWLEHINERFPPQPAKGSNPSFLRRVLRHLDRRFSQVLGDEKSRR
jgi:hypothetical protein